MDKTTKSETTKTHFLAGASIIIVIAIAAVSAGVATLVFGAYGCGKLFARWLPFSAFESTVVSLLALVAALGVTAKLLSRFLASMKVDPGIERCAVCGDCHDVEEHADDDEVEVDLPPNEGLRLALYASGTVKPNAPCPCGSDRRYSKCCGDGRLFRQRGTTTGS